MNSALVTRANKGIGFEAAITDESSAKTARKESGGKTTSSDVLINNAGINGGMPYTVLEARVGQFMTASNRQTNR